MGFLDGIESIDLLVVDSDARMVGLKDVPMMVSNEGYEDFDKYSAEKLMELFGDSDLRKINSFYALDNLSTAIKDYGFAYKLTGCQRTKLMEHVKKRELSAITLADSDVKKLLELLNNCQHSWWGRYIDSPDRIGFPKMHGYKMVLSDYMSIVREMCIDAFKGAVKNYETKRLGSVVYEFLHDPKGYRLEYDDRSIDNCIKIYVKLLPFFENNYNIAIISFHDTEDNKQ